MIVFLRKLLKNRKKIIDLNLSIQKLGSSKK